MATRISKWHDVYLCEQPSTKVPLTRDRRLKSLLNYANYETR